MACTGLRKIESQSGDDMIELGLIGNPLGHSSSPLLFADIFSRDGVEGSYSLFPLHTIADLPELLNNHPLLAGFNVTIPYKQAVIPYLDDMSDEAQAIGAVNTVLVDRSGGHIRMKGFNTDCRGFISSLGMFDASKCSPALLLGTGGAARAVAYALSLMGIKYSVVSRSSASQFEMEGRAQKVYSYADLNSAILDDVRLIVNATPAGMFPDVGTYPPVPWQLLGGRHILYDLVYNPVVTEFMKRGLERGCIVVNGMEMLRQQAEKAWEIWRSGIR